MQAAVVSVLLMAGACADSRESLPAPTRAVAAPAQFNPQAEAVVCDPSCPACSNSQSSAGEFCCHEGLFGSPHYSPVWLLHKCAIYYPGNYARPYDYREVFNYPWNGPRPAACAPPMEFDTAARATTRR